MTCCFSKMKNITTTLFCAITTTPKPLRIHHFRLVPPRGKGFHTTAKDLLSCIIFFASVGSHSSLQKPKSFSSSSSLASPRPPYTPFLHNPLVLDKIDARLSQYHCPMKRRTLITFSYLQEIPSLMRSITKPLFLRPFKPSYCRFDRQRRTFGFQVRSKSTI